ncbi:hypothetical protein AAULR_25476, partial [Lacticaseibacillus rhamnosus MTCC 5462]
MVWDSDRFEQVVGESAAYSRLSYEHKLSLYLVKRIPSLFGNMQHRQMGNRNHLGFAVEILLIFGQLLKLHRSGVSQYADKSDS